MKKIYLFLAMVILSVCNIAQTQNLAEKNDIEIKGIKLGMIKSEAEMLLGTEFNVKPFTIAGIPSKKYGITSKFIDDKLSEFSFSFNPTFFPIMLSAVKEKYPELTCETSEVKNNMGATFEQKKCMIKSNSGNFRLSKYSYDLITSRLSMTSVEQEEKYILEMKKQKKDI